MVDLVVFTDLDGTLLDHATYSYEPALPALKALKAANVPLVLASSKTAAEIASLHAALGLGDTPAIVENGAGLFQPGQAAQNDTAYAQIRAAVDGLPPDLRQGFKGFGDMTPAEIAQTTGLSAQAAREAAQRCHSEPGLWTGDESSQDTFLNVLKALGISARQGGRFLTLSFGATKADRMAQITQTLGAPATLALGDAPNDREMIETADRGVIIRNDHGPGIPSLPGEARGTITRTALPGPEGWNLAVLEALDLLTKKK